MNTVPSWDLYRTFDAVLRTGSLSAAARNLGLTQPSVSRHIDMLEQAVGARLFLRTPRGLSPTATAEALRPYADLMASTSNAFLRTAGDRDDDMRGSVRISASEVVGTVHLPAILQMLRRDHPALAIELSLSNDLDDLLMRKADIAIRMVRPTQQSLLVRRLGMIMLGLHAHRTYLDAHGTPETRADLADHDLIGFDRETPAIRALQQQFPSFDRARFALRVDSDVAQLFAIRQGCGIGICQVPIANRDANLIRVLAGEVSIGLETFVVMHEDLRSSPRCRAVFDALVSGLLPLTTET